jgi:hypothetical protein
MCRRIRVSSRGFKPNRDRQVPQIAYIVAASRTPTVLTRELATDATNRRAVRPEVDPAVCKRYGFRGPESLVS